MLLELNKDSRYMSHIVLIDCLKCGILSNSGFTRGFYESQKVWLEAKLRFEKHLDFFPGTCENRKSEKNGTKCRQWVPADQFIYHG